MEALNIDNYGDGNRAFLQAIMARGTLTFEESRPILAAISNAANGGDSNVRPDQITEDMFMEFIDSAAAAVSLFDYEVRHTTHQLTNQRVFALVNTTSDPQTQMATTYSADEVSFIKRMLDAMFHTYNTPRMEVMAITEMQAIKLARPQRQQPRAEPSDGSQAPVDRGLKHSEVEDVLATLTEGGWLEKSRKKFYSLTPRGLLELRPWLIDTYNNPEPEEDEWQPIKSCEACKDLITIGLRCADPGCNFRLHDICQDAFWRARSNRECPRCSKGWTGRHFVGERAHTETDAYKRGHRTQNGGGESSRRTGTANVAEEEEEEEEEESSDEN